METLRRDSVSRRSFLSQTTALGMLALTQASEGAASPRWTIGCFNRPWNKWDYNTALEGMKAAGYKVTGFLTTSPGDPMTNPEATPEYLAKLKDRVAARGLTANMTALRFRPDAGFEAGQAGLRAQLDRAATMGLKYAMSFGVDRQDHYAVFYRLMADAARYGQDKGIQVVVKPHGGGSGASDELLTCLEKVNHPNFAVWYDAGNIIHYTGKDPVADLKAVAKHVTGFCAKDCAQQRGEVMIQFGQGKVDFPAVFKVLQQAGFNGPIMVECCKVGATAEETTAHARANREFLERTLAKL